MSQKTFELDPVKVVKFISTHTPEESANTIAANIRYYQPGTVHTEDTCNPACLQNQFCDSGQCWDKLGF